jgi:hypothetical protein
MLLRKSKTKCTFRSTSLLDVAGNDDFKRKIKNSYINWYYDELIFSNGMKLGKAASDVKISKKHNSSYRTT